MIRQVMLMCSQSMTENENAFHDICLTGEPGWQTLVIGLNSLSAEHTKRLIGFQNQISTRSMIIVGLECTCLS